MEPRNQTARCETCRWWAADPGSDHGGCVLTDASLAVAEASTAIAEAADGERAILVTHKNHVCGQYRSTDE